jgi:cell fate regulator YaaT (PSP1 superfamily)
MEKFEEGELIRFIKVRFPGQSGASTFYIGDREYAYGQPVMAKSERGMAMGYINSFPFELPFTESMLPLKSISKNDPSDEKVEINDERIAEIENICRELIIKHKLDMNLTHVDLLQFGKKGVFYFTAPERVDFRELVKDLVSTLRMQIELRQISIRERTAALGGIGTCGRQICCSSFLKGNSGVSIKMVKNQNIALHQGRINGICGQIKCCMRYENDVYSEKRELLPKENSIILAKNGDIGKVINLNILREEFELITRDGKLRRYKSDQYQEELKNESFPKKFDQINDETDALIE